MSLARTTVAVLLAGWLADRLASTDVDVEAGIGAYEAGNHDDALAAFDRAVARLGERAELSFDRGLVLLAKDDAEGAKSAFERASEADDANVRASAFYELGNLAFEAEDWDGAIAHYTDCLKARPEHENAKWNLELALLRKQKKEEEEEDKGSSSDDGGSDESGGSETGGESGESGGEDEQKQDEQKQDEQKQDEGKGEDAKEDRPPPEQPPTPMDRFDLQRALDQLDEQDEYPLDRGRVRVAPPAKDW